MDLIGSRCFYLETQVCPTHHSYWWFVIHILWVIVIYLMFQQFAKLTIQSFLLWFLVNLDLSNHNIRLKMHTVISVENASSDMMMVSLCSTTWSAARFSASGVGPQARNELHQLVSVLLHILKPKFCLPQISLCLFAQSSSHLRSTNHTFGVYPGYHQHSFVFCCNSHSWQFLRAAL